MSVNTITSNSAGVAGSAGSAGTGQITLTFPAVGRKGSLGVHMYIQMSGSEALVLTPSVVRNSLGTAAFGLVGTSGLAGTSGTTGVASITIPAGAANYRIPLPVLPGETSVVVKANFAAGTDGVCVIDFAGAGEEQ